MKNFLYTIMLFSMVTNILVQSAERPPQPPKKLPTFGQMIKGAEERQKKERQAQPLFYARRITPASLHGLPADLQRAILLIIAKSEPAINIYELTRSILSLAGTDKALRLALNDPENMIAIFNALPYTANAIALAAQLQTQPGAMPVIKNPKITAWIKNAKEKLEAGEELYEAVAENNIEIVTDFLKNKNIDLNWVNSTPDASSTALRLASERGYAEIVRLLLAAGPSPFNTFESFLAASAQGHAAIVNQFLIFKDLIKYKDIAKRTALMYASANGHADVVRILLAAGAKIDLQDGDGMTALMHAAQRGQEEVVRILLDAGANLSLKNIQGKDADRLAFDNHHFQISLIFIDEMRRKWDIPPRSLPSRR